MKVLHKNIYKFLFCLILLLIAYIPTLRSIIKGWMAHESYYGHGFFIPLVSLFILWQRRNLFREIKISTDNVGLIIVVAGLIMHLICAALKVYFISGVSFVFVLFGLVLFFFGREVGRNLIFPIFFLLAMIPLPGMLIAGLTIKLKLFAAQASVFLLNNVGFKSLLDGSTIRMPASYLMVEAPCSGLRSLISLLTLGLLFSYALKSSYLKKGILLISAVPIALATNILRITMLAAINDLYGEKIAMGFFHDFSGFLVFALAFLGLYSVGNTLKAKNEK